MSLYRLYARVLWLVKQETTLEKNFSSLTAFSIVASSSLTPNKQMEGTIDKFFDS